MKVAILLTGKIVLDDIKNFLIMKRLFKGCDIFINSDIGPEYFHQKFSAEFDRLKYHKVEKYSNFMGRGSDGIFGTTQTPQVIQWLRYDDLLNILPIFDDYDVVLKWRFDFLFEYMSQIEKEINTFYEFFEKKKFDDNIVYMMSDIAWYGKFESVCKLNLWRYILTDYCGRSKDYYKLNYELLLQTDFESGRWENQKYPKKFFSEIFKINPETNKNYWYANENEIKRMIRKNLNELNDFNSFGSSISVYCPDKVVSAIPDRHVGQFHTEKIFCLHVNRMGLIGKKFEPGNKVYLDYGTLLDTTSSSHRK